MMIVLWLLVALLGVSLAVPIPPKEEVTFNRQIGETQDFYITSRNNSLGQEERVCVIDKVMYREGENVPTTSNCETCICRPPGFACTFQSCDYHAGCKAIKRADECCPTYQCDCEKNGTIIRNGDRITDENNPCKICYCQGGDIMCTVIQCFTRKDCEGKYEDGKCCPTFNHCSYLQGSLVEISAGDLPPRNRPQVTASTIKANPLTSTTGILTTLSSNQPSMHSEVFTTTTPSVPVEIVTLLFGATVNKETPKVDEEQDIKSELTTSLEEKTEAATNPVPTSSLPEKTEAITKQDETTSAIEEKEAIENLDITTPASKEVSEIEESTKVDEIENDVPVTEESMDLQGTTEAPVEDAEKESTLEVTTETNAKPLIESAEEKESQTGSLEEFVASDSTTVVDEENKNTTPEGEVTTLSPKDDTDDESDQESITTDEVVDKHTTTESPEMESETPIEVDPSEETLKPDVPKKPIFTVPADIDPTLIQSDANEDDFLSSVLVYDESNEKGTSNQKPQVTAEETEAKDVTTVLEETKTENPITVYKETENPTTVLEPEKESPTTVLEETEVETTTIALEEIENDITTTVSERIEDKISTTEATETNNEVLTTISEEVEKEIENEELQQEIFLTTISKESVEGALTTLSHSTSSPKVTPPIPPTDLSNLKVYADTADTELDSVASTETETTTIQGTTYSEEEEEKEEEEEHDEVTTVASHVEQQEEENKEEQDKVEEEKEQQNQEEKEKDQENIKEKETTVKEESTTPTEKNDVDIDNNSSLDEIEDQREMTTEAIEEVSTLKTTLDYESSTVANEYLTTEADEDVESKEYITTEKAFDEDFQLNDKVVIDSAIKDESENPESHQILNNSPIVDQHQEDVDVEQSIGEETPTDVSEQNLNEQTQDLNDPLPLLTDTESDVPVGDDQTDTDKETQDPVEHKESHPIYFDLLPISIQLQPENEPWPTFLEFQNDPVESDPTDEGKEDEPSLTAIKNPVEEQIAAIETPASDDEVEDLKHIENIVPLKEENVEKYPQNGPVNQDPVFIETGASEDETKHTDGLQEELQPVNIKESQRDETQEKNQIQNDNPDGETLLTFSENEPEKVEPLVVIASQDPEDLSPIELEENIQDETPQNSQPLEEDIKKLVQVGAKPLQEDTEEHGSKPVKETKPLESKVPIKYSPDFQNPILKEKPSDTEVHSPEIQANLVPIAEEKPLSDEPVAKEDTNEKPIAEKNPTSNVDLRTSASEKDDGLVVESSSNKKNLNKVNEDEKGLQGVIVEENSPILPDILVFTGIDLNRNQHTNTKREDAPENINPANSFQSEDKDSVSVSVDSKDSLPINNEPQELTDQDVDEKEQVAPAVIEEKVRDPIAEQKPFPSEVESEKPIKEIIEPEDKNNDAIEIKEPIDENPPQVIEIQSDETKENAEPTDDSNEPQTVHDPVQQESPDKNQLKEVEEQQISKDEAQTDEAAIPPSNENVVIDILDEVDEDQPLKEAPKKPVLAAQDESPNKESVIQAQSDETSSNKEQIQQETAQDVVEAHEKPVPSIANDLAIEEVEKLKTAEEEGVAEDVDHPKNIQKILEKKTQQIHKGETKETAVFDETIDADLEDKKEKISHETFIDEANLSKKQQDSVDEGEPVIPQEDAGDRENQDPELDAENDEKQGVITVEKYSSEEPRKPLEDVPNKNSEQQEHFEDDEESLEFQENQLEEDSSNSKHEIEDNDPKEVAADSVPVKKGVGIVVLPKLPVAIEEGLPSFDQPEEKREGPKLDSISIRRKKRHIRYTARDRRALEITR